jgi:hypothetical protein
MRHSCLIALLNLASLSAYAAAPPKVTGIYSNLHYIAEGGDVIGTEIFIVNGGRLGYFAVLQCAEGAPSKPVVVAATVKGTQVEFASHADADSHCPKAKFTGAVTPNGLRGTFEGTDYPGLLERKRSYWQ